MSRVITQDPRIVLNKFIKIIGFALILFLLNLAIGFMGTLDAVWAGLAITILMTAKKALDEYNPEYAQKFNWFFQPIVDYILKKSE